MLSDVRSTRLEADQGSARPFFAKRVIGAVVLAVYSAPAHSAVPWSADLFASASSAAATVGGDGATLGRIRAEQDMLWPSSPPPPPHAAPADSLAALSTGLELSHISENGICRAAELAPTWHLRLFESVPRAMTLPHRPLSAWFEILVRGKHDHPEIHLSDIAIGQQPVTDRPRLLYEWNEPFLSAGFLQQGHELPSGLVTRPALWVFGEVRSAMQYFDSEDQNEGVTEWANRLDLFGQWNLTGTERLLLGLRPLDEETSTSRDFSSVNLGDGRWNDGFNAGIQTLFFEGDFGEVFPWLDPYDARQLDYGFSVGRMPLLAQQGLLINEDRIDALTLTRNTLSGNGILNLRITGVYAWNQIGRRSPTTEPTTTDPDSRMAAILTESDFYRSTVNLDVVYVQGGADFGDVISYGASAIRRLHGHHHTYNTSIHLLASFPTADFTPFAQQGELFFAQTSWTPHHSEDLIYLNAFLAVDRFTSPARGPLAGGPLGQTGIVFAAPGLGAAGAPISVSSNDAAGVSVGYQFFFEHTRRQLIFEVGGEREYEGGSQGAIAAAMRYQQAIGQHHIFVLDGFVGKVENLRTNHGARVEVRAKF